MRRILVLFVFFIISCTAFSQKTRHIVLISIDGFRPDMYLDKSWPSPNLQRLMAAGLYARHMKSVFPSYTYPSHVAMLTGALPARSGIYYNNKTGSAGWNWFTKDIRVPTLWQAVRKAGMTSAAVEWPVSVSEDITYDVPEIWDTRHPEDRITEARKYATKGLVAEIERNATGQLNGDNMNEEYGSMDANAARMAAYIFRTCHPNLLAVHFAGVDGKEHEFGRDHEQVRLALANVDHGIGVVLESIERSGLQDSTTVIIVGDHGFADIHTVLRVNAWLAQQGVTGCRFQAAGGSAFLYLDNKNDPSVLQAAQNALAVMPSRYKKLFRMIDRRELDVKGVDSSAVLALAAIPGVVFSSSSKGPLLGPAAGGHHGYDPDLPEMYTGFIAAGAGIRKGMVVPELCVTDVAPLIAALLHIGFTAPDGVLFPGMLY